MTDKGSMGGGVGFAQQLIFRGVEGGARTVVGLTLEACLASTCIVSHRIANQLLVVTMPYVVSKVSLGSLNVLDVALPRDFYDGLGEHIVNAYLGRVGEE